MDRNSSLNSLATHKTFILSSNNNSKLKTSFLTRTTKGKSPKTLVPFIQWIKLAFNNRTYELTSVVQLTSMSKTLLKSTIQISMTPPLKRVHTQVMGFTSLTMRGPLEEVVQHNITWMATITTTIIWKSCMITRKLKLLTPTTNF